MFPYSSTIAFCAGAVAASAMPTDDTARASAAAPSSTIAFQLMDLMAFSFVVASSRLRGVRLSDADDVASARGVGPHAVGPLAAQLRVGACAVDDLPVRVVGRPVELEDGT